MTATAEEIDFGAGVLEIDLDDLGEPTEADIEVGNRLFAFAIVDEWLELTPDVTAFLIAEHQRIGRTLTESEVYDLVMARSEFRGLIRRKPKQEKELITQIIETLTDLAERNWKVAHEHAPVNRVVGARARGTLAAAQIVRDMAIEAGVIAECDIPSPIHQYCRPRTERREVNPSDSTLSAEPAGLPLQVLES